MGPGKLDSRLRWRSELIRDNRLRPAASLILQPNMTQLRHPIRGGLTETQVPPVAQIAQPGRPERPEGRNQSGCRDRSPLRFF
jgi:hypothetical protein